MTSVGRTIFRSGVYIMKKSLRIQKVIEVLDRWGRQSKAEIDHKVSVSISRLLDSGLERALYRDLEDLVSQNKVQVEYYSRDGGRIENYDPAIHKNVQCKWYLFTTESKVTGGSILKKINSKLYCPKILADDVILAKGESTPEFDTKCLYFSIAGLYLVLKINMKSVPVKIIISRSNGDITKNEVELIESKFGKRSILLKVPSVKVSSFDISCNRLGHIVISIDSDSIKIKDLDSTNGTTFTEFSKDVSDEIRLNNILFSTRTVQASWSDVLGSYNFDFKKLDKEVAVQSDVLINLASDILFLCV